MVGVGEMERTQKHNMGRVDYKEEEKAVCMNVCRRSAKHGVQEKIH